MDCDLSIVMVVIVFRRSLGGRGGGGWFSDADSGLVVGTETAREDEPV